MSLGQNMLNIENWKTCSLADGDTCNPGYVCCLGKDDVAQNKQTCRQISYGDCVFASSVTTGKTSSKTTMTTTTLTISTLKTQSTIVTTTGMKTTTQVIVNSPSPDPSLEFVTNMPKGMNVGLGSWFYANDGTTSNGQSWCGYPYDDKKTIGFAPDITLMTEGKNSVYDPNSGMDSVSNKNWVKYTTQYCGLEAVVTNPNNGVKLTLYLVDAFNH
ncbi:hypothetical protein HK096_010115, partial [Nowakowskiella sp. JEL0078]